MNLQEFTQKVKADRLASANALRQINLAKSQAFLATLAKPMAECGRCGQFVEISTHPEIGCDL